MHSQGGQGRPEWRWGFEHECGARELKGTVPLKADGCQSARRHFAFEDLLEGRVERGMVKKCAEKGFSQKGSGPYDIRILGGC